MVYRAIALALLVLLGLVGEAAAQCSGQPAGNTVCAAPNGAAGVPNFRSLVTGDLPSAATQTIQSGNIVLSTSAIGSALCGTTQTLTETGVASTDTIIVSFAGDPTGITGYVPSTSGMLTIFAWAGTNSVNFKVCNNTAASITPGAAPLNWRVVR